MRNLLWFCTAIALFTIPFAAEAQFPKEPKSRPAEAPQATAQAAPTPPVQAAPQVAASPVVVAASTVDEIKSWINTALAGLIALFLGKIGFKPAPTQVVQAGLVTEPTTATGLLKTIQDPSLRAQADQAILTVIRSGIPGMALQSGASLVPGVGPMIGQAEPILRSLVDRIVSERLSQNKAAVNQ